MPEPLDVAQLYETTLYNHEGDEAFAFFTIPKRSLVFPEVPPLYGLAAEFGIRPIESPAGPGAILEPVEAWSLPFLLDALMGRWRGPNPFTEWTLYFDPPNRRGPSRFAQHLVYGRVVPVESSPLAAVSLADLVTSHEVGALLGYVAGHPVLLLKTSGVIIVGYAVRGIGQAVQIALRTGALQIMGIGGDRARVEDDEGDEDNNDQNDEDEGNEDQPS